MKKQYHLETLSIRAGHERSSEREHCEAIFATSSFIFDDAQMAADIFSGTISGNAYSRFSNPTVDIFEKRLCALEKGERCVATSSGMSAIFTTIMAIAKSGDHIVSSQALFGSTYSLLLNYVTKFGIEITLVDLDDLSQWEKAVKSNTKLFFLETPSNPLIKMGDIKEISQIAKKNNIITIVDNCFATPILQQPLTLGADIVVHSATKYIDGQGRCMGGAIIGDQKLVGETIYSFARTTGPTLSPFNAWLLLKGLETLSLRMKAHCENALLLAQWLENHPKVEKVFHIGLSSHPQHELAKTQMHHFGGMVSFEVKGGRENAWKIIDHCQLFSITSNLGDIKSTITHPATTTHGRLSEEERQQSGIHQGLIRLSVGLEHIEDLKNDLATGLDLI